MDRELSIDLARNLESIKRRQLKDTPVVDAIANLIHKYNVTDLELLTGLQKA